MGVSQPYTTVDVQMQSHAGSSETGYSAGIGVNYLTALRQTKTFQTSGRIDKIKKAVSFEVFTFCVLVYISSTV